VRGTAQFQQYLPLSKRTTLAFNTELSVGKGTNGLAYPVFKTTTQAAWVRCAGLNRAP